MMNISGKYNELDFEYTVIELLNEQGYVHVNNSEVHRELSQVLLIDDLKDALWSINYNLRITEDEINYVIKQLTSFNTTNLYEINKHIYNLIVNGIKIERYNDEYINIKIIDFDNVENNTFKVINQFEVNEKDQLRKPDIVVFVNGIPLVVFELKNVTNEDTTIEDAYKQLTIRYRRDIPSLFYYNAFIVISDGSNNRYGSFFSPFEHFYAWRLIEGTKEEKESEGIDTLYTLIKGLFNKERFLDVYRNFIIFPDKTNTELKIIPRYPQYYATKKLTENIRKHLKPQGDGKGGIYFGATGCGKSITMVYLARSLMSDLEFKNPTLVYITDRNDLDEQLSQLFLNCKNYIGDSYIKQIESRENLKKELSDRKSGGVFLTTIQKFYEGLDVLSDRPNIICISDEAHRSQTNLDLTYREIVNKETNELMLVERYGLGKYLRDSLPNATYVGFTGTPIDATIEVFGEIVDSYDMRESVRDGVTVNITYEGRAAKVLLDHRKVQEIEEYYDKCVSEGANIYQIEESKKAVARMEAIIGDEDRIKALANDFVHHYEERVLEGATVKGKAMFVCMNRVIAYKLYKEIIKLRPEWNKKMAYDPSFEYSDLSERELRDLQPIEKVKLVITRNQDDEKELYELAGTKEYRQELAKLFKHPDSNFKIAIIVDMWLTGFDVPCLDTMYIDKPIQKHTLIQTISRVNRTYEGKSEGLIVDYIGIKSKLNEALSMFSTLNRQIFRDIDLAVKIVKDELDILNRMFHKFDSKDFFGFNNVKRLETLNKAVEFAQHSKDFEKRFMDHARIMKRAYNLCINSESFTFTERQLINFYLAIRSVIYKMISGDAPSPVEINERVRLMLEEAIKSQGVEQLFIKSSSDDDNFIKLLSEDNLAKVLRLPYPNTKIKILERLLKQVINNYRRINKIQSVKFSERLQTLVKQYETRFTEPDPFTDYDPEAFLEEILEKLVGLASDMVEDMNSFQELGMSFEEKAFYDVLIENESARSLMKDETLRKIASEILNIVKDNTKYVDWHKKENIKAEMRFQIRNILDINGYPPDGQEVAINNVIEQAENFKYYN